MSRCVRRKGPKWLVAIVSSRPSSVICFFISAVPALCIKTFSFDSVFNISAANSLIDFCEDKSNFLSTTFVLFDVLMMSSKIGVQQRKTHLRV